MRLTTSLLSWGKVFWLCFAGSTLAPESLVLRRNTLLHQQPSRGLHLLLVRLTLVSYRGKLATVRITPSSWGSQRTCASRVIKLISGAVAGEIKTRCKGSLSHPISLLCLLSCFTLFYFLFCLLSLYQKHTKISYLHLLYFLFCLLYIKNTKK